MTFLTLQSIGKSYDGVVALDGIDLSVPAGSRTVIVGPSASGKTTLLRIIAGFETPDHGVVAVGDQVLADARHAVPAYRRGIGYITQDGALFPHLTVGANIGFGLYLAGNARELRILQLLDMVELAPSVLSRRPDQLSGGQQQRVAIARALAQRPRLMLLDEPFSALDTGLREATRKAVGNILSSAGITTILVTHDQAEALSFADQVAVLHEGQLAQVGSPREVYARPQTVAVARYLGDAIVLAATVADGYVLSPLGRVQTSVKTKRGHGTILLRPEQICIDEVTAASITASDANTGFGEVVDIDYAGAYSSVVVRLTMVRVESGQPKSEYLSPPTLIAVRRPNTNLPAIGATVRFRIDGEAHVFPVRTATV